jgi:hypothetical protein
MRVLLICALAAILIGCTRLAQPQATTQACSAFAGYACSGPPIAPTTETHPSVRFGKNTNPAAKIANYTITRKMKPAIEVEKEPEVEPKIEAKTEPKVVPSAPAELNDKADPVTEKAKATIAATMENPASAEFREMRRAARNALGQPIDTICGYVKGKSASGGDIGEKQFVYIVQLDEAYIVDDSGDVIAPAAYRYLCN